MDIPRFDTVRVPVAFIMLPNVCRGGKPFELDLKFMRDKRSRSFTSRESL